jgi:hypothetical protein
MQLSPASCYFLLRTNIPHNALFSDTLSAVQESAAKCTKRGEEIHTGLCTCSYLLVHTYFHVYGVSIDGVWVDDRIYWTP